MDDATAVVLIWVVGAALIGWVAYLGFRKRKEEDDGRED